MSFLPITAEELRACAERWGWLVHPYQWFAFTSEGFKFYTDVSDIGNSAAILDRERVLRLKGCSVYCFYRSHKPFVSAKARNEGKLVGIEFSKEHSEALNFRSWLLVQLTLQLPPEVWK